MTPVTVEITRRIPDNCHGLYHCDDNLIQLRPLEDYAENGGAKVDHGSGGMILLRAA
jgi:hypothetical protein